MRVWWAEGTANSIESLHTDLDAGLQVLVWQQCSRQVTNVVVVGRGGAVVVSQLGAGFCTAPAASNLWSFDTK